MICSTTDSGVSLNQAGERREYGMAEADMPFPLLCIRPIFDYVLVDWCYWRTVVVDRVELNLNKERKRGEEGEKEREKKKSEMKKLKKTKNEWVKVFSVLR